MSEDISALSPWVIRPLDPGADLPVVARLLAAVEEHDEDGELVTEATLRERLTLPGHDPALDQMVATPAGVSSEVIGWMSAWHAPGNRVAYLDGAVHPVWRGHGIGGMLLRHALRRARKLGASAAGSYASSGNLASTTFLQSAGFHPVSANTLLRAPGNMTFPAPHWPAGFTLSPQSAVLSIPLLAKAYTRCYQGLWGHNEHVDEEQVASWLPEMNPYSVFVITGPDDDVAGICQADMNAEWTERDGVPTAYVDAPGVTPEHRAQGLYLPLLLAALSSLREKSPATILLESWGDADETLALYESFGFTTQRRSVAYEMALAWRRDAVTPW